MKKSTIDPEVKKILEKNNYDFHKISQDPELANKVNKLNFNFKEATKQALENPIDFTSTSQNNT